MKKKAETKPIDQFHCEHCGRNFVRETTLSKHLCEQKRRWDERNRPNNRIAFSSWLKFYSQFQPTRKKKEYKDFISSAYYMGFSKYGTYCIESNVVNPQAYSDWLLKEKIPLDNWASDKNYTKFLVEYLRSEDSLDAISRSVKTMLEIANNENIELRDVFRLVNSNKLCYHISTGHISPWILYKTKSGVDFLEKINADQMNLIYEYIDPDKWNIKFRRDKEGVESVLKLLKEINDL